jgi:hydroxypyruvate isomerase
VTGTSATMRQRLSPCLEWIFAEPEDIGERIGEAAKDGMKQVEFWYWRRRDVGRMADALKTQGVGVSAVVVDPQADIADRGTHKAWLANVRDSANVAAYLGSPVLVATAGKRLVDGPPDAEQLGVVTEALRAAASLAAQEKVVVALEPLNERVDHPGTLLASSLAALELVQQVGSPALGILLDIYHSHAMGEDVPVIVSELGRHIAHVQVADDPGRHEPGTGRIPWGAALMALDKAGYAGSLGLEYKPTMPSAESVDFTANVLGEAVKRATD